MSPNQVRSYVCRSTSHIKFETIHPNLNLKSNIHSLESNQNEISQRNFDSNLKPTAKSLNSFNQTFQIKPKFNLKFVCGNLKSSHSVLIPVHQLSAVCHRPWQHIQTQKLVSHALSLLSRSTGPPALLSIEPFTTTGWRADVSAMDADPNTSGQPWVGGLTRGYTMCLHMTACDWISLPFFFSLCTIQIPAFHS